MSPKIIFICTLHNFHNGTKWMLFLPLGATLKLLNLNVKRTREQVRKVEAILLLHYVIAEKAH